MSGVATAGDSQGSAPSIQVNAPTYADLADLALAAPIAAHVRVARAQELKKEAAAGVRPGFGRVYIEAEIVSLIRSADGGLPSRIRYVVDLPRDPKGKVPKVRKGTEFLVFGLPVPGKADEIQLAAPDAQIPYAAARTDQVRTILRESTQPDAAPRITGIGRAFHVPGAIPGESETQIFLQTAANQPVSMTVLRRPGETPQWAVALSEIVDDAAAAPKRDSLLWYRLACTLPRALPGRSLADADAAGAAAIQNDYRFILEQLGPCPRTRTRA
ncbi:hypothetical protein E2493_11775 [Sphingomonas parva]|uniref:Uncharacterized protein n=1 Tax=Sphingomonas parva TaxID=2555898 RepID=A0A4Y8ZS49_9SPHN|nr:hypothetical protein E2493_11775 [Sphingomonas parva]